MLESSVIDLLQRLIKKPSITPMECGIYDMIEAELGVLKSHYNMEIIRYDEDMQGNSIKKTDSKKSRDELTKNILYAILPKGLNLESASKQFKHFCFAGHIDVVPSGDGWEDEPFSAKLENGYIYGRGAQDMKAGVSAFVYAVRDVLLEWRDKPLNAIVSILLTSDEEGDGIYGTRHILELLRTKDILPNACIVAEPTSVDKCGDMIKIGRRGSINGILVINGKQGHVAYPEKCINPVEILGSKLGEIAGKDLDNGNEYFAPSKMVVTDIRGGLEVTNVTPNALKIMFNVRNSPLVDERFVREYIESHLGGIDYKLTLKTNSLPFITKADSALVGLLRDCIKDILQVEPTLSTSGGTSDARLFAALGIEVVELGVRNDRIHAINERVSKEDVLHLCAVFMEFLKRYLSISIKET